MSSRVTVIALLAVVLFSGCRKKHPVMAKATAPAATRLPAPPKIPSKTPEQVGDPRYVELGIASWYGQPFHGRAAANGEIYDMEKLTAAHKTLPFGTWVRVTNLANNKTVDVRITDRGPFIPGRIIDLSHAAAQEIELIGPGVAQVRLDIMAAPEMQLAGSLFSVQAGIFQDRNQAEHLRESLEKQFGAARLIYKDGKPGSWRLLVGVEDTTEGAKLLARKIQSEVGSGFVVRLDEIPSTSAAR
ncbi:MAG: septal ring lytic transglycosylase RlpA family protein [Acidobacteriota bacterium]|nr:septal ring lytic transglycosylase RlpA family protein [Acidobacteriota bacterium]